MNEKLKAFLAEWEKRFPGLDCLSCFRISKIRIGDGEDYCVYDSICSESDKLRCIAPGFLDALGDLEGVKWR